MFTSSSKSSLSSKSRPKSTSAPFKALPRKPLQVVDTNVASYNRRDPFAAIDALRKLMTVLPSRPGGSQYKLSQKEHELSLFLLSVVEPFIGMEPSQQRTLTRHPTEILDEIASNIESKRDLLALGLTCKRMHNIVMPRHFEYRVIRAKLSNIALWNHLTVHRLLARNVRRLEVLDERSSEDALIPSDVLKSDTDLESSDDELQLHDKHGRMFVVALAKMTRLNGLVWSNNHSLVSFQVIWPTLLKCTALRYFDINDNAIFSSASSESDNEAQVPRAKRSLILPSVSTVAIRSQKRGNSQNKVFQMTQVVDILHHCPNLLSLDISNGSLKDSKRIDAGDFFNFGRWPSLRSLALTNLICTPDSLDAASSFLFAHSNLEVLHLDVGRALSFISLPEDALPRLKELKSSKEFASALMACPSVTPRPLETLKGMRLMGQAADEAFFDNLRRTSVKRLELAGYNELDDVKRLVDYVPNVVWLDVGKKNNVPAARKTALASSAISNVTEWSDHLGRLSDLTTLHGVRFFYEVSDAAAASLNQLSSTPRNTTSLSDRSRIRKNDEVSSILSWKCPKLRRLDHWDEHAGKIVVLVKDKTSDKVRWEVRRVKN